MSDWHSYSHEAQHTATKWIAVLSVALAWCFGYVISQTHAPVPWWLDTPAVFGFFGILYAPFDRWLWRTRMFRPLHGVPDLSGTYDVTIRSSHDGLTSTQQAKAVISQSWTHIVIRLETDRSSSVSQRAWLVEYPGAGHGISYFYCSTPKPSAAAGLHKHDGTTTITFDADRKGTGFYYTGRDRMNIGEIVFNPVVP